MKTKAQIIERLLENKSITAEEAVILLQEQIYIPQSQPFFPSHDGKVPFHTICGCMTCNCTMANKMVYPGNNNWETTTTFKTIKDD